MLFLLFTVYLQPQEKKLDQVAGRVCLEHESTQLFSTLFM